MRTSRTAPIRWAFGVLCVPRGTTIRWGGWGRSVTGWSAPGPDLFAAAVEERLANRAPLAARLRPRSLDEVVGQQHLLGPGKSLGS